MTFGLNALRGRHKLRGKAWGGAWDHINTQDFINYTVSKGYVIDSWEFGNNKHFTSRLLLLGFFLLRFPCSRYRKRAEWKRGWCKRERRALRERLDCTERCNQQSV